MTVRKGLLLAVRGAGGAGQPFARRRCDRARSSSRRDEIRIMEGVLVQAVRLGAETSADSSSASSLPE